MPDWENENLNDCAVFTERIKKHKRSDKIYYKLSYYPYYRILSTGVSLWVQWPFPDLSLNGCPIFHKMPNIYNYIVLISINKIILSNILIFYLNGEPNYNMYTEHANYNIIFFPVRLCEIKIKN